MNSRRTTLKDLYCFEFKSIAARNNDIKILGSNGFDYELVEDLKGYAISLPKSVKMHRS